MLPGMSKKPTRRRNLVSPFVSGGSPGSREVRRPMSGMFAPRTRRKRSGRRSRNSRSTTPRTGSGSSRSGSA